MNRQLKRYCVVASILAAGVAGVVVGREVKSEETLFADIPTTEGKRPYRHGSHFTTSIVLPSGGMSSFSTKTVVTAQFIKSDGTASGFFWDVYSQVPSVDGKRLVIVFIAKHPKGPGVIDQAAGTGTIQVSTTDSSTCPATTTNTGAMTGIPVMPVDTNPCP
jgi:hypothetical protein